MFSDVFVPVNIPTIAKLAQKEVKYFQRVISASMNDKKILTSFSQSHKRRGTYKKI